MTRRIHDEAAETLRKCSSPARAMRFSLSFSFFSLCSAACRPARAVDMNQMQEKNLCTGIMVDHRMKGARARMSPFLFFLFPLLASLRATPVDGFFRAIAATSGRISLRARFLSVPSFFPPPPGCAPTSLGGKRWERRRAIELLNGAFFILFSLRYILSEGVGYVWPDDTSRIGETARELPPPFLFFFFDASGSEVREVER